MNKTERIDPVYSATEYRPSKPAQPAWLYPRGEYEAFMLAKMCADIKGLKLLVGYPGVFRPPVVTAWFRNANPNAAFACANGYAVRTVGAEGQTIRVTVSDSRASIPALQSEDAGWLASVNGVDFSRAVPGGLPTGDEQPRVALEAKPVPDIPGLYDVGREVLADLVFHTPDMPSFKVGESLHEVKHVMPATREQTFGTVRQADGSWKTPRPLAFRYVSLSPRTEEAAFEVHAAYTPLVYRRAYDFGDAELNRIWEAAAYTLRLCILTFQIDGVKRDRLPWGGDLALSLLANAYSFREPDPIRRTLTVLGRDGVQFSSVNGILDYSLWIVISHAFYQEHFGDAAFLAENWPMLTQVLDWFAVRAEAGGGLLRPVEEHEENGVAVKGDWCFIDWLDMEKTTALQMVMHWAFASGAKLAGLAGDAASAKRYADFAAALRARINQVAFDPVAGLYRGDVFSAASKPQRHANFLAVISGVAEEEMRESIARGLLAREMPEAGTPYMISLEILALHRLGRTEEALAKLRRVWGGMLRLGATTFFEGYDDAFDERSMCVFYGRPFGMSLCHAWSAAPCALLPMLTGAAPQVADGKVR